MRRSFEKHREKRLAELNAYYHANKERSAQYKRLWRDLNRAKFNETTNLRTKRLTDGYCRQRLKARGFELKDITEDLIEVQRLIISINREITTK